MSISSDITQFRPTTENHSRLRPFERTPRFETSRTIRVSKNGTFQTEGEDLRPRLKGFCRLNRPTAVAVVTMSCDGVHLDVLYHHAFHPRQMEGMLSLGVHMGEKRIADTTADLPLEREDITTFLDSLPEEGEIAFLLLDRNGLHRFGRAQLLHEALHLFCNRKEST